MATDRYRPQFTPLADPAAVVAGERYRLTVLTDGVVRLEWSEDGVFEDRASTFAINRALPVPEFSVRERAGRVEVTTARMQVSYDQGPFTPAGLVVQALGGVTNYHSVWRFGETVPGEGGTARTLDYADGAVPLGPGVVSRNGLAVVDDSDSFLFGDDGMPASRRPGTQDLYVFVHGRDYRAAIRDLYAVSGPTPLLPRWALGNWWSRYHAYTADTYRDLLDRFDEAGLPFSVAVIDMDWHHTEVDPVHGSGWTGYSWNRELFPDPASFLAALHERGLRATLNVHPADGIRSFEDSYPAVAEALGVEDGEPIPFEPTDRAFLDAYFDLVHHPLEKEGVDFWWLDWQQGAHSRLPGADPLWLLNHFHFLDSGREGRRPLTFSRYAGPGSHRYPVGFSGDAVVSWASLDFQPYFTATASNIGYGWWSHDIGGHVFGVKDDVLATRWVQFGVFSPINRLHSANNPYLRKEPWSFGGEAERAMTQALRFRHRLIPYLHTMNARAAFEGEPLVQPVYWSHPDERAAYRFRNTYLFGSELLVAPITTPQDAELLLGSARAWLPPGRWTDVFTGTAYEGGREVRLHRTLDGVPALLRDGGILPLATDHDDALGHPQSLELLIAPGTPGRFELVEEPGEGDGRDRSRWATTAIEWTREELRIAASGDLSMLPRRRRWTVTLLGAGERTELSVDGAPLPGRVVATGMSFELPDAAVDHVLTVTVGRLVERGWEHLESQVEALLGRAQVAYERKVETHAAVAGASGVADAAARLTGLELGPALEHALLELVLARPGLTRPTPRG
ncbi:glycoside hydrolase family 31 protein [Herbiconiux sp. SYSU D00978]|uniref:glycoside hydrolase family 31 protein n=1 Tax=Herbiconiux sp. SYSU D00978 TaxID=2812562 RepID=UPI001A960EDC|nr:TIM-barrel domain-containing protein [Herbiconiux sp. SYSU D00978]